MHFCCTEAVVKALVWKQLLTMLKQWKGWFLEYRIWTQVWNAESPDWTFRRMHGFSFQFFKVYILSLHTLQVSVDSRQLFMKTVPLVQINEKTFPGITVIKELSLFIYNLFSWISDSTMFKVQIPDVQTTNGEVNKMRIAESANWGVVSMTKPPCQRGRCGCPGVLVLRLFSALGEAVAGVPVGQEIWRGSVGNYRYQDWGLE